MKIPILAYIAAASFFFPSTVGIYKWKEQDTLMKVFIVYCCFSSLHVIVEYTIGRMGMPTHALSNLHQLVELTAISFVYFKYAQHNGIKNIIQYGTLVYVFVWILYKFTFEEPQKISELIQTSGRFILICFSTIILFEMIRVSKNGIIKKKVFWIVAGVILYSAGTIIIFTTGNKILTMGMTYFEFLWHFNWTLAILANSLFVKGILCKTF